MGTAAPLAAIDSWLLEDGRVRGLERHRARFAAAVAGASPDARHVPGAADVERFLKAAFALLPTEGRSFPRIELTADGDLRLWLRPAPAVEDEVVVYATPFPDRRRRPQRKGPDLARQHQWRSAVEAFDAGEGLLAAPAGTITEGIWSTPLWWDGDVLCALPRRAPVLDSVTRSLVLDVARELDVEVGRAEPSVGRLRDSETWMLSALHGIRLVTGWLLVPGSAPEPALRVPGRAAEWQARLQALAAPVVDDGGGGAQR
ncbi:hypothetical protein DSM112329_00976 [Paraconexibacter sp. AEG42_29]|uniref:Aminotransferase class IV n=1 Tax=Paraconexibacter sp. AEG42_29 TaxID=2997339 RepID=A0AAU7AR60_9ACTN